MAKLPSQALRRTLIAQPVSGCAGQQVRHASLLRRPKRPYTFTQLVTLSDGSTYTQRTTSPRPILKLQKDTRNHPMWNPSLDALRNTEEDTAGRLRAFRLKFGRGWDVDSAEEAEEAETAAKKEEEDDNLMNLLSGYAANDTQSQNQMKGGAVVTKTKGKKK